VLFAWSALGASFGPLVLLALAPRGLNRYGALAGMLTGAGVTVAWKLGRTVADNPTAFAVVPLGAIVVAVALLVASRLGRALRTGHTLAVAAATLATLASWWLVQHWGLHHLYELVPAFSLAGGTALLVARLAPVEG